jgi:hypothetical protein
LLNKEKSLTRDENNCPFPGDPYYMDELADACFWMPLYEDELSL